MSIVVKSDPKPSTFNLLPPTIQKSRSSVKLIPVKTPQQELADQIRSLESTQVENSFTYGGSINRDNKGYRCVMGALAVEKYGAKDDPCSIVNCINATPILKNYWGMLADMNNNGSSFAQIADYVESGRLE